LFLRLLVFVFLVYIVVSILRSYLSRRTTGLQDKEPGALEGEELVRDPQCQSYIPKKQALFEGGNYFCSAECAKRYLSR